MNNPDVPAGRVIGRRGMIIGTTATALATGLALAPSAAAAPPPGGGGDTRDGAVGTGGSGGKSPNSVHPDTSPINTTIASAPTSGYVYRTVDMYDFKPFDPNANLTWGGSGTYSAGTATALRASVEIPPGALAKDVEYYIYNNSGANFVPDTYLYVPGQGTISSIGASATVPSGTSITATRATVSQQGPYPLGSRLLVSGSTPTTGLVQLNGARVGFTMGAGTLGQFDLSVRGYDSRSSGGRFAAGSTRIITLPASVVKPGVVAVTLNVISLNCTANGLLKVYSAALASPPTTGCLYYRADGFPSTNQIVTGVSAARQIKVTCTSPTDVILDIVGVVS